ncbi:MAG TPA: hypothetical protein VGR43_06280, partial [Dehalococcoidia bacterium]|nr:hypothetical protein [Dehalococcoidia bacterium]
GSVQTIEVNADNVRRFEIVYRDSAGLTGIEVCPPEATPSPSATPAPTASPTPAPTASATPAATASPTPSPVLAPTAAPTASPAPAPTAVAAVTAAPVTAVLADSFPTSGGSAGSESPAATWMLAGALGLFTIAAVCEIVRRLRKLTE